MKKSVAAVSLAAGTAVGIFVGATIARERAARIQAPIAQYVVIDVPPADHWWQVNYMRGPVGMTKWVRPGEGEGFVLPLYHGVCNDDPVDVAVFRDGESCCLPKDAEHRMVIRDIRGDCWKGAR